MKLVYKLEVEVPDDAVAQEVQATLQWAWKFLRFSGWKLKVAAMQPRATEPVRQ